jgi:hypothetical protein
MTYVAATDCDTSLLILTDANDNASKYVRLKHTTLVPGENKMRGAAVDYFADFGGILPHLSEIIAIYGGILLLLFRRRLRRKADSHRPIWRKARRIFVTHLCSLSRPSQSISSIAETHAQLRGAIADTFTP